MTFLLLMNLATILLRPTFNSCAISEGENRLDESLKVEYREAKGKWIAPKDFHGDLMGLKEGTDYEVRVLAGKKTVETGKFRTWSSEVPVARTIEIDPATFEAPFKVDMQGSEKGWIRITVKGGVLHNPSPVPTFIVDGAAYVLLDDMTLRGAADSKNVIKITNSKAIRVRNCDIAEWGESWYDVDYTRLPPENRYKGRGNGAYFRKNGQRLNWDAAILISKGASEVVVERCYIHDPLSRSVSWYYLHPAGPEAVGIDFVDHSTVIRWCDFVASDGHNWNDAVEGAGNFIPNGGFNRDADIYGNFMIFANDDCIELDGGQRDVRCYGNRFESALCGVSVQGCMVGPSFVCNNLFSGMGEIFGLSGETIKTSTRKRDGMRDDAHTYLCNNILWGKGSGIAMREPLNATVSGNKFCGRQSLKDKAHGPYTEIGENEFKVELEEKDLPVAYPLRDLPFTLSRARISVGTSRKDILVDIKGKLPEGSYVAIPSSMPWISGTIEGNKLRIKFDDSRMHDRRQYRAALLVRTPQGLSRPLSIYAESDFVPPLHAEKPSDIALYADNFKLTTGGEATVEFNVEKEGRYWCMVYGRCKYFGARPRIEVSVDGKNLGTSIQQSYEYPAWSMLCPDMKPINLMVYHFDFKPGKHTFTLKGEPKKFFEYNAIVLTDNPESFEPNRIPLPEAKQ